MNTISNASGKLPAGRYYIGDLCYVIGDWDAFCDKFMGGNGITEGVHEWKGKSFFVAHTAYGDGVYNDEDGNEYSVDAGLIGALPADLIDRDDSGNIEDLGHIVDFPADFEASCEQGEFIFGHITIQTGDVEVPWYDEDEDEDDDWDEDDEDDEDWDEDDWSDDE